jgi:hypothetical protein
MTKSEAGHYYDAGYRKVGDEVSAKELIKGFVGHLEASKFMTDRESIERFLANFKIYQRVE